MMYCPGCGTEYYDTKKLYQNRCYHCAYRFSPAQLRRIESQIPEPRWPRREAEPKQDEGLVRGFKLTKKAIEIEKIEGM